MYTYNELVFGINFNEINPQLVKDYLNEVYFPETDEFIFHSPYHGGITSLDEETNFICGIIITDDDQNKNFLKEYKIAESNRDYYLEKFNLLYIQFKNECLKIINKLDLTDQEDIEYKDIILKVLDTIDNNIPDFYLNEASS